MNLWIVSGLVTLIISAICAFSNAYELISGKYTSMLDKDLLSGRAFHIISALIGLFLLYKGIG